jgi:hypothetical protein
LRIFLYPSQPKRPLSAYNYFFMQERKRMLDARTYAQKKDHDIVVDAAVVTGFAPLAVAVAAKWRKVKATDLIRWQEVLDMAALDKARYNQEMHKWLATRGGSAAEAERDRVATIDGLVHVTDEESLGDNESHTTLDVPVTTSEDFLGGITPFAESGLPHEFVHSSFGRSDFTEGIALEDASFSQTATGSFGDPSFLPSEISIGRLSTEDNEYKSSTWKSHCHFGKPELTDSGGGGGRDLDYEPLDLVTTASALQNWPDVGRFLTL